jgi:hypothetical protein
MGIQNLYDYDREKTRIETGLSIQQQLDRDWSSLADLLASTTEDMIRSQLHMERVPQWLGITEDSVDQAKPNPEWQAHYEQFVAARARRDEIGAGLYVVRQRQLAEWREHGIEPSDG